MQGVGGSSAARALRAAGGLVVLGLAMLLAACGGGGGGGGGTGGGDTSSTRPEALTLSVDTLTTTARVGESPPVLTMTLTVTDLGTRVYGAADPLTRAGVDSAGLTSTSGNTATVSVTSQRSYFTCRTTSTTCRHVPASEAGRA